MDFMGTHAFLRYEIGGHLPFRRYAILGETLEEGFERTEARVTEELKR